MKNWPEAVKFWNRGAGFRAKKEAIEFEAILKCHRIQREGMVRKRDEPRSAGRAFDDGLQNGVWRSFCI